MTNSGRYLENLVRHIESLLLPEGFSVVGNTRAQSDQGLTIAEFDIEVRGKLGSGEIAWLIECRDRSSEGPAPASWIEQLVGRRNRFGFNKVTAVSATGFSSPAIEYARSEGIDLRETSELKAEDVKDWLLIQHVVQRKSRTDFVNIVVFPPPDETETRKAALAEALVGKDGRSLLFRASDTGKLSPFVDVFAGASEASGGRFDKAFEAAADKEVRLVLQYVDDNSYFLVDTALGPVRVAEIRVVARRTVTEMLVPISRLSQYADVDTGKPIAQVATFDVMAEEIELALEMNKISETGETLITLRKR